MIEVTQYKCEVCGNVYEDSAKCQECEDFHIPVEEVQKYLYYPKSMGPEARYPYGVIIKTEDGEEFTFKR